MQRLHPDDFSASAKDEIRRLLEAGLVRGNVSYTTAAARDFLTFLAGSSPRNFNITDLVPLATVLPDHLTNILFPNAEFHAHLYTRVVDLVAISNQNLAAEMVAADSARAGFIEALVNYNKGLALRYMLLGVMIRLGAATPRRTICELLAVDIDIYFAALEAIRLYEALADKSLTAEQGRVFNGRLQAETIFKVSHEVSAGSTISWLSVEIEKIYSHAASCVRDAYRVLPNFDQAMGFLSYIAPLYMAAIQMAHTVGLDLNSVVPIADQLAALHAREVAAAVVSGDVALGDVTETQLSRLAGILASIASAPGSAMNKTCASILSIADLLIAAYRSQATPADLELLRNFGVEVAARPQDAGGVGVADDGSRVLPLEFADGHDGDFAVPASRSICCFSFCCDVLTEICRGARP